MKEVVLDFFQLPFVAQVQKVQACQRLAAVGQIGGGRLCKGIELCIAALVTLI